MLRRSVWGLVLRQLRKKRLNWWRWGRWPADLIMFCRPHLMDVNDSRVLVCVCVCVQECENLTKENAAITGHQNLRQKIQYHAATKHENTKLKEVGIFSFSTDGFLILTFRLPPSFPSLTVWYWKLGDLGMRLSWLVWCEMFPLSLQEVIQLQGRLRHKNEEVQLLQKMLSSEPTKHNTSRRVHTSSHHYSRHNDTTGHHYPRQQNDLDTFKENIEPQWGIWHMHPPCFYCVEILSYCTESRQQSCFYSLDCKINTENIQFLSVHVITLAVWHKP